MHGRKEIPYDYSACFVVEKHKAKYLKRTLPIFELLQQFEILASISRSSHATCFELNHYAFSIDDGLLMANSSS